MLAPHTRQRTSVYILKPLKRGRSWEMRRKILLGPCLNALIQRKVVVVKNLKLRRKCISIEENARLGMGRRCCWKGLLLIGKEKRKEEQIET